MTQKWIAAFLFPRFSTAIFPLLYILFSATAFSQTPAPNPLPWPEECREGSLGTPGQPNYQLTLVCMPKKTTWNGNVIAYAHGFVMPDAPLALPTQELSQLKSNEKSLLNLLLDQGFALITTSYSRNGWAIENASKDLNALVDYFKSTAPGPTKKVLLIGASEGGLITTMQLEKYPNIYQGGLALCGAIGGAPFQIRYIGDFRVVFDYFFPDVFEFGVINIPPTAATEWKSKYVPKVNSSIEDQTNSDQLFRITRAAEDSSDILNSRKTTAQVVLGYSVLVTNDLIQVAGGNPYGNQETNSTGSNNDQALNAGLERVSAVPAATDYLTRFYQPTGDLQVPLIAVHNTQDPHVPFQHELIYGSLATSRNRLANFTSIPVPGYGHCAFQEKEVLGALALLFLRTDVSPNISVGG
jgi:pimeloyl-ACP methyl ester carboxylesterase